MYKQNYTSSKRNNWNHLRIIQNVPEVHTGKAQNRELQETATLGTAHILRKVLMHKHKTLDMGNSSTCAMNCNYRIAAALYIYPTNTVCFRYIIVNTLHEGDNE
jgi:hypothetical protein